MRRCRLQTLAGLAVGLVVAGCGAAPERLPLYGGPAQFSFPGPAPETLARAQGPEPGALVRTVSAVSTTGTGRPGLKFHGEEAARIAAVVNGEAILMEDVEVAAAQALAGARSEARRAEILKEALNQVIDREVVLQDAFARLSKGAGAKFLDKLKEVARQEFDKWMHGFMRASHLASEAEVKSFLRAHGLPFAAFRRKWERDFLAREYLRQRVDASLNRIGHEQIVEYYEKHPEEFKVEDKVEWQDLFIAAGQHPTRADARQLAAVLAERVRRGEDFARLANEFDNGDAKFRGAEGQGGKRGEVRPSEAEAVLFQLSEGEVGPLIELPTGFHVIRLVKRTRAGMQPFDDEKVQKQIRDKLRGEVFLREMKRIVSDLKRKSVIEIAPVF
jgi:parvulin-like peptidyl-prolyl isomerase